MHLGSNLKHILTLLFLLIIIYTTLTGITYSYLSSDKDYKKYRLKDCINSKDCIWTTFEQVAFGLEFNQKYPEVIKRFNSKDISLGYYIEDKQKSPLLQSFLQKYISLIDYHTTINLSLNNKDPDILLLFVNDYDFRSRTGVINYIRNFLYKDKTDEEILSILENNNDNLCYLVSNLNTRTSIINKSIVFVRLDLKDFMLDACIQEEVTQAMGLFNDIKDIDYSLFNDDIITTNLTELDFLMLDIIYNEQMRPGLDKGRAKKVFNRLHDKIRDVTNPLKNSGTK